ncbi:MAG TPA: PAS domain S-box protein, partial [Myxococcaceae bacterium]|nr:PAS domain S-box protein [Myxococcaceae bacterium]
MAGEVSATSILIVDDHPANLRALEGVLEPLGHRVVKANSGHEALKHLLNEEFAVVLLDVQMPGLDGFETARLIKERERSRDIPILFLTALSWDEKRVVRGYSHGAVDYIHKPFEPEILRAKVKVFIDLHRRTESLRRREAALARRERATVEDGQERLRQSERALEVQGRSLRTLTDNATLGLVMMDARQHCTFMNPAAEKIFGYTFAEVQALNRPLHDVVHHTRPDGSHFPMEECPIDRALPQKMQEQGEDVFVRKDGTFYPVAFTASPILDNGVPVGTVIEVRDITERRTAEAEHRASEERFRAVVAALSEGIVVQDARGEVRLANHSAEQLLGVRFDEVEGRTSYDPRWRITREDGAPHPADDLPPMVALRTGKPVRDQVIGCMRPDGTVAWLSLNSQPLFGADGRPEGVVTSLFDITERRLSEAALRENERQFRTLADSIPQLAWMADSEGFIFWYNQRWYDYTGTRLEEMQGWGWRSVHDPAELPRVEARFRAAIASGEPWEDTFPLRRADGQFRWHLSRAMPVRDAAGRVVRWFGTNTDVEDQRRAQRESQFLSEVSTVLAGSLDYEETLSRA